MRPVRGVAAIVYINDYYLIYNVMYDYERKDKERESYIRDSMGC